MEWIMIFSIQWIVNGVPLAPTLLTNVGYESKDLCDAAADALRAELAKPIPNAETLGRIVCVQRK